jgi:hypothetical protein
MAGIDITLAELLDNTPRSISLTAWRNPTVNDVRMRFFIKPGAPIDEPGGRCEPSVWLPVFIPAGGEIELPSTFNKAIQTVKDNLVIGGMAPQLVRADGQSPPIHPALATPRARRWKLPDRKVDAVPPSTTPDAAPAPSAARPARRSLKKPEGT